MSGKHVILLSDPILKLMDAPLRESYEVERLWENDRAAFLAGRGKDIEAIVYAGEQVLDHDLLLGLPKVKLIACVGVGFDGVDVPWCRAHGIEVTHAHWLNADDVADTGIGLMIAAYRGLVAGDQYVRSGAWAAGQPRRTYGSLLGKTAGIVGLGAIGTAFARRCEAMGMKIAWWGPRPKDAPWRRAASVLELARDSDVLFVACRADESNRNLIDREVIDALGHRACLVNVSRGQVVDEDACIAALKDGRLGMAGLDVFWKEPTPAERWKDVPNTVLTPHIGGSPAETVVKLLDQSYENLRRHFAGEPLLSPVGVT